MVRSERVYEYFEVEVREYKIVYEEKVRNWNLDARLDGITIPRASDS